MPHMVAGGGEEEFDRLAPAGPGEHVREVLQRERRAEQVVDLDLALGEQGEGPGERAVVDRAEGEFLGQRSRHVERYGVRRPAAQDDGGPQAGRLDQAFLETVGVLLPYAFPLFRIPVEAARLLGVHNDFMAEAIRAEAPATVVVRIPMAAREVAVA